MLCTYVMNLSNLKHLLRLTLGNGYALKLCTGCAVAYRSVLNLHSNLFNLAAT